MTATLTRPLPTHSEDQLAKALRELHLPGQRSKTAIMKLRRERAKRRRHLETFQPDVRQRLYARLVAVYSAEIERRGGETEIRDNHRGQPLRIVDREQGLTMLHVAGWRAYSRAFGVRHAGLSYLCGKDDGKPWAVRVPSTITTVIAALSWITPQAVWEAKDSGRRVIRQGDVYAIETLARFDSTGELPPNHHWSRDTRVLSHPEHGIEHLPYPVRFVPQKSLAMGRLTLGPIHGYGD